MVFAESALLYSLPDDSEILELYRKLADQRKKREMKTRKNENASFPTKQLNQGQSVRSGERQMEKEAEGENVPQEGHAGRKNKMKCQMLLFSVRLPSACSS